MWEKFVVQIPNGKQLYRGFPKHLTAWNKNILEQLILAHLGKIFHAFYASRRLTTAFAIPAAGYYSELVESNPHPQKLFDIRFNIILPSTL
jgi:hypothetical protein